MSPKCVCMCGGHVHKCVYMYVSLCLYTCLYLNDEQNWASSVLSVYIALEKKTNVEPGKEKEERTQDLSNRTAGRVVALHVADPDSTPNIPYSPLEPARSNF